MIAHTLSYNYAKVHFANPKNTKFDELLKICIKYFGDPRITGSHYVFKTPWKGDPLINIQRDGKMAKPYQVKLVNSALGKKEVENSEELNG